ncbi:GNAT family N-acetyltransferase [Salegentibacter salegens]|uniref:Ribosomal protein S18 acetylase RimI n=1 Tax=Salegentibacter salegens TaxID=143223 RepID=A0A1M7M905_9FLAO|nr:GNAT family N-acetyltransferase [Salegentibacter salegens]PRX51538.1 ribosomal protein S18 acetylase RimI-like enzyme [Salegentibacter salegens]SHM86771.1 Ribosomal protein S18 acetylase RimI [Salegentibacter salegens]
MIKKASLKDLPKIKNLTEACAEVLQHQNIFQWNEHYPSRDKLQNDVQNKELYVFEEENMIIAIIVLTSKMDEVYRSINWLSKTGNNLYVHRLATHPNYWGKGYARKMMDFAEEFATSQNFSSIRLDTFSKNKRNQKFYEARDYTKLGDVYFPHKNEHPFHCYEKLIATTLNEN